MNSGQHRWEDEEVNHDGRIQCGSIARRHRRPRYVLFDAVSAPAYRSGIRNTTGVFVAMLAVYLLQVGNNNAAEQAAGPTANRQQQTRLTTYIHDSLNGGRARGYPSARVMLG
ncbi:uncharacterized protein B0H64DRAFT_412211 [Chaetomium fimeti]|uniref:Uncharacterized protein n=1 Tax=Chaetomium fimeti TaxID=1854472 RepID=A0AAE0LM76_9PEZI|nr:hypothetical protein B0H64DRAFT_412211 [Chaetomium fimeti]